MGAVIGIVAMLRWKWGWIHKNSTALTFVATVITGIALATFAGLTYRLSEQLVYQARQPQVVAICDELCDNSTNCYERIVINNNGGPLQVKYGQIDTFVQIIITTLKDGELQRIDTYWFPLTTYFEQPKPTGNFQLLLFTPAKATVSTSWLESVKQDFSNTASLSNTTSNKYSVTITPSIFLGILYQPGDDNNANSWERQYYAISKYTTSFPVSEEEYDDIAIPAFKNMQIAYSKGYALTIDQFDVSKLWVLCKNHILEGSSTIIK